MPTIVVTGASRGIGFAILEKFAAAGWQLAFCSKQQESVDTAHNKLRSAYPNLNILARACDMSQKEEVIAFGQSCLDTFGQIDILVNNAGIYIPGSIASSEESEALEQLIQVNLYSAYWLGKIIVPQMIAQRSGHIFNMSSIAGLQAYANGGAYAISKFALTGYTRTLREELKTQNIRVTGLYPGATLTDSWSGTDLPASRFVQASDIADIVFSTYQLSPSAVVEDIIIRPQLGDI